MKTTRRIFLGGLAAASVPLGAAAAATVDETQKEKCIRLAQDLLAELRQIEPSGESTFGSYVDVKFGTGNSFRYGRGDEGGEILTIFVPRTGGDQ